MIEIPDNKPKPIKCDHCIHWDEICAEDVKAGTHPYSCCDCGNVIDELIRR